MWSWIVPLLLLVLLALGIKLVWDWYRRPPPAQWHAEDTEASWVAKLGYWLGQWRNKM